MVETDVSQRLSKFIKTVDDAKGRVRCLITCWLVVRSVLVVGTELFNISNWILTQTCSPPAYWLHSRVCIHCYTSSLHTSRDVGVERSWTLSMLRLSQFVSVSYSLTVTVTKELGTPVEQNAKSINLRGTPPPPAPSRHVVSCYWAPPTPHSIVKFNLRSPHRLYCWDSWRS